MSYVLEVVEDAVSSTFDWVGDIGTSVSDFAAGPISEVVTAAVIPAALGAGVAAIRGGNVGDAAMYGAATGAGTYAAKELFGTFFDNASLGNVAGKVGGQLARAAAAEQLSGSGTRPSPSNTSTGNVPAPAGSNTAGGQNDLLNAAVFAQLAAQPPEQKKLPVAEIGPYDANSRNIFQTEKDAYHYAQLVPGAAQSAAQGGLVEDKTDEILRILGVR